MGTMASSIETGLGARMTLAENTKSLLATVTASSTWSLSNGTEATVPYSINTGNYNDGFTLSGGIATVNTAGVYSITASSLCNMTTGYADLRLYRGAGVVSRTLGASTTAGGGFAPTTVTATLQCAVGDAIKATLTVNGVTGSASIHTGQQTYNVLAITLIKAL
jgi:hypothetical protein